MRKISKFLAFYKRADESRRRSLGTKPLDLRVQKFPPQKDDRASLRSIIFPVYLVSDEREIRL